MHIDDFKSTVAAFSDPGTEILFEKNKVVFSMNGDLIDVSISSRSGDIFVEENGSNQTATSWILKRLARLPLLATRIKDAIGAMEHFVAPSASILASLEARPDGLSEETDDAVSSALNSLNSRSPMETTVLYVTSDAGEGKTWLINQIARKQADLYSSGQSDWILVPIILGGRHFLRFDDITVGALQNRYRFPFLYYNSFLALVRMGVIVPAFDGFEEMFVESSSGEAISAMGLLLSSLRSAGAVVVAARNAYFEFEDLKMQERLYDTISSSDVGFGKIQLHRWGKRQFLEYGNLRSLPDAEQIYERVKERIGETHSLLTRPVLVKRLVDIAIESPSLEKFLDRIRASGTDFFSVFVRGIIEREANDKWIDRSGDVGVPLLTADEHCELLSQVALAMWDARVDFLKRDLLEFSADYFCESKRRSSLHSQQIRDRLRGHALLISSQNSSQSVEFDHEEFRMFFLGEGVADQARGLNDRAKTDLLSTLRKGILPKQAQYAFDRAIRRSSGDLLKVATLLMSVGILDGQASYTQENCSTLLIRLIGTDVDGGGLEIKGLAFGTDALRDKKLRSLNFVDCYFSPSSLENTELRQCSFSNCRFGQLRIYNSTIIDESSLDSCEFEGLRLMDKSVEFWSPEQVQQQLSVIGFKIGENKSQIPIPLQDYQIDPEMEDFEKILRYFLRSTHISESVMKMKLGIRGQSFIDDTLPTLEQHNLMVEIENRGGGNQRRFKLGLPLHALNTMASQSQGSFSRLLARAKTIKEGGV